MYSIDRRDGQVVLRGRGQDDTVYADGQGLTALDCMDLDVKFLDVNNNPLTSLKGGPRKSGFYNAINCGLTALEIGYAQYRQLNVKGATLPSLYGCGCGDLKVSDGTPLLFAVGRATKIEIDGGRYKSDRRVLLADTVFRAKLRLIEQGNKPLARLCRP